MRFSVDQNASGWRPGAESRNAKVFLDGSELNHCVSADDELGECVCLVLDEEGVPKFSGPQCGAPPLTEVRRGKVKIVVAS
jgi:hypothetical protein